jgi:hypothetical protein
MTIIIWLIAVWIGGIAVILGSLMTLGSLLLWISPGSSSGSKSQSESDNGRAILYGKVKLLGISIGLTLLGIAMLRVIPLQAVPLVNH